MPELSDDVIQELYSVPPDQFLFKRAQLADAARRTGEGRQATAIDKLRKPTLAAWIVNAQVLRDPSIIDRLTDLGERMRAAQDALDPAELRTLSTERRKLIDKITAEAFKRAERKDPPAALRDEVTGTFDAAIADEAVAARLGRLQRAEHWSGFGFPSTGGAPDLTLVRGGKDEKPKPARKAAARQEAPKRSAAEQRRLERTAAKARDAFTSADGAFENARKTEQELTQEVRRLTKRLAKLQDDLDAARARLEQARSEVTSARTGRREAQSALDRAERDAT